MKLTSFDFRLPERLIAQVPLAERDQSRLMVVRRDAGTVEHRTFHDLPEILGPEHFLVVNSTRVFPARLWAHRPGREERIEVLFAREETPQRWLALTKPARKANPGQTLSIGGLTGTVAEIRPGGGRVIEFPPGADVWDCIQKAGEPPLPPYIHRAPGSNLADDRKRYQTIFASQSGSIAAPTAALHFTPQLLERLEKKGVFLCKILLHVGYGTFQPVRCEEIEGHRMEPEYFEVSEESAAEICRLRAEGRSLIAVGTTTTRVLEHLSRSARFPADGASGFCDLFIYPGFEFHALGGLITNFHLPRSTLFMLVCAFAGRDLMMDCYRQAIEEQYRFFSYGDSMLIL